MQQVFTLKDPGPTEIRWLPVRRLRLTVREAIVRVAKAGETVVDMGCGDRPYQRLLEARGMRYVGCDLDGDADVRLDPDAPVPLQTGSVALVTSFQVLEHVPDVDFYLRECRRLLRPGGVLLLSTHGVWPYHPHPHDYWRWTYDGLEMLLQRHGFTPERLTAILGPVAWSLMIQGMALNAVGQKLGVPRAVLGGINLGVNGAMALLDAGTPAEVRRRNASIYVAECSTARVGA